MTDDNAQVDGQETKEKRVLAAVQDGQIEHQTQPLGEPQAVEERKRELVRAFAAGRAAAPAAAAKGTKANQGSVIAIVGVAVVLVLLVAAVAIIMWRVSKGEAELREFVLENA